MLTEDEEKFVHKDQHTAETLQTCKKIRAALFLPKILYNAAHLNPIDV